jgi:hypothetical protein
VLHDVRIRFLRIARPATVRNRTRKSAAGGLGIGAQRIVPAGQPGSAPPAARDIDGQAAHRVAGPGCSDRRNRRTPAEMSPQSRCTAARRRPSRSPRALKDCGAPLRLPLVADRGRAGAADDGAFRRRPGRCRTSPARLQKQAPVGAGLRSPEPRAYRDHGPQRGSTPQKAPPSWSMSPCRAATLANSGSDDPVFVKNFAEPTISGGRQGSQPMTGVSVRRPSSGAGCRRSWPIRSSYASKAWEAPSRR